jgi:hypothetical protein
MKTQPSAFDITFAQGRLRWSIAPRADFAHRLGAVLPSASYAALLVGIALAPFTAYRFRGSIIVSDAFLFAAGGLLLLDLVARRARLWAPMEFVCAAGLVVFGFLAAGLEDGLLQHGPMVIFITLFYTCFLIPVIIASQHIVNPSQVKVLIYVWLISNVVHAGVIACQSQGIDLPSFIQSKLVMNAHREGGLTLHPNSAGYFASMPLPVCFACLLAADNWRTFVGWISCTVLLLFAIDQTGSRTALLSGLIGCGGVAAIFMFLRNKSRWMRGVIIMAIGAGVVLFLLGGESESALSRLLGNTETSEWANAERAELNAKLMADFWANPFFGNRYQLMGVHQVFIGTLGVAGLVGFLALILREFSFALRAIGVVQSLREVRSDFALAAGLPMIYVVQILAYLKNFVIVERVGFIGVGLMVLFYLHQSRRGVRLQRNSLPLMVRHPPVAKIVS